MMDSTIMEKPQLCLGAMHKWWVLPAWFLATSISGFASWAFVSLVSAFAFGIPLAAIATVTGACVGLAQWFVLQSYTQSSNKFKAMARWTVQSAVAGTIGWLGALFFSFAQMSGGLMLVSSNEILAFFVGGAAFGLVQWLTWEGKHPGSVIWWAFVNAVGWSAGGFLGVRLGDAAYKTLFPNYLGEW